MQRAILAVALALCLSEASAETSSPLPKVVELLKKLKEQLTKDGEKEKKEFDAYMTFCHNGERDFGLDIKGEKGHIEDDDAVIDKSSSDISVAKTHIDEEGNEMSDSEASLKKAKAMRKKGHDEFKVAEADLMETIDSLERATNILQREMQGGAFIQKKVNKEDLKVLMSTMDALVNAASISLHDKSKLTALVQASENEGLEAPRGLADQAPSDAHGAPEVDAYESHSGSILDMLEDMKQKAEAQLTQLRKEEQNARNNFNLLGQSLQQEIDVANKEMGEAKDDKNVAAGIQANAKGDLAVLMKELGIDQASLSDLKAGCRTVADEYVASVKGRSDEMAAIDGGLTALADVKTGESFLQLEDTQDNYEVVTMLRKLAEQQKSTALTQLAGRVSTTLTQAARRHEADPFAKVRNMISDMVDKLKKEAGEEAEHKAYCDKEKKETQAKKDELQDGVDKITAQLNRHKANSASLKGELKELQEELATLAKDQGEADALRQEQAALYKTNKEDLSSGGEGVRMALKMLKKFYQADEAKEEAALIQTAAPLLPSSHKSHAGTGNSVISILEMVEENMAAELSKVENEETTQQEEYEKETQENTEARITKEQGVKYKTKESAALEKTVVEHGTDLDGAQSELDAVLEYEENIKQQCNMNKEESYEERKARREAEIEGMKSALAVLEGDVGALIQTGKAPRQTALRGAVAEKH